AVGPGLRARVAAVLDGLFLLGDGNAVGEHLDARRDLELCLDPPAALANAFAAELGPARAGVFGAGPDETRPHGGLAERQALQFECDYVAQVFRLRHANGARSTNRACHRA